jgi:hypothetical protein
MNITQDRSFNPDSIEGEYNLVEMWCSPRRERLIAGVFAGIFAGTMMLLFGMIVCAFLGMDLTMPFKICALPVLGVPALAYGSMTGILVGLSVFYTLMIGLGVYYAHVTGINKKGMLFWIGVTWGLWGWVFITNLMMPSFREYLVANVHKGAMFAAWQVYGISLMSVAWFDKKGYIVKNPVKKILP